MIDAELRKGTKVSCELIPEMVIHGFVSNDLAGEADVPLKSIISDMAGLSADNQVVCSDRLFQVHVVAERTKECAKNVVMPIFHHVELDPEPHELPLETIYYQPLTGDITYNCIKACKGGGGYNVSESSFRNTKLGDKLIVKDHRAFLKTEYGDVICKDAEGCITGVCGCFLVLCRYIHQATGKMNFALFEMNELYVEVTDEAEQ